MTTQELYDALICKPDLHSAPELQDRILVWYLYEHACVQAFCNHGNSSIEIVTDSVWNGSLIHWHPDEEDMVDELYVLGKKGNMLVLKKSLLGTSTVYAGPSETCPFADRTPLHFGKTKWDGGHLIYLEQKQVTAE